MARELADVVQPEKKRRQFDQQFLINGEHPRQSLPDPRIAHEIARRNRGHIQAMVWQKMIAPIFGRLAPIEVIRFILHRGIPHTSI